MSENGIAKAADFRRAFEAREPAVRLVLPKCGLPVEARRLSPLRVLTIGKRLEDLRGLEETERNAEFAKLMLATIQDVLVRPPLALNPSGEEIDPNWVPMEDGAFLFNWGMGTIADDGTKLDEFFRSGAGRADARGGASGGDVRSAAERADEPDGIGGVAV